MMDGDGLATRDFYSIEREREREGEKRYLTWAIGVLRVSGREREMKRKSCLIKSLH